MDPKDLNGASALLAEHGFEFVLDVLGYFQADWGKLISIHWIEAHSLEELGAEVRRRPSAMAFEFVFEEPPSENVARQLRDKLSEIMGPEELLRALRRVAGCAEGESILEAVEKLKSR